jgi:hypothetical protein
MEREASAEPAILFVVHFDAADGGEKLFVDYNIEPVFGLNFILFR